MFYFSELESLHYSESYYHIPPSGLSSLIAHWKAFTVLCHITTSLHLYYLPWYHTVVVLLYWAGKLSVYWIILPHPSTCIISPDSQMTMTSGPGTLPHYQLGDLGLIPRPQNQIPTHTDKMKGLSVTTRLGALRKVLTRSVGVQTVSAPKVRYQVGRSGPGFHECHLAVNIWSIYALHVLSNIIKDSILIHFQNLKKAVCSSFFRFESVPRMATSNFITFYI